MLENWRVKNWPKNQKLEIEALDMEIIKAFQSSNPYVARKILRRYRDIISISEEKIRESLSRTEVSDDALLAILRVRPDTPMKNFQEFYEFLGQFRPNGI